MKDKSILAKNIEYARERIQLDDIAKHVLANKTVLSRLLKGLISEYKDVPLEVIKNEYIDETHIGDTSVVSGELIKGGNTESTIPDEGSFSFDLLFDAIIPNLLENGLAKIIVNVEAQGREPTEYDISTRGVFYCSRMISSQYGREFSGTEYNKINKVYSIWICMNVSKNKENTIERFGMDELGDKPNCFTERYHYDKLEVIRINLSKEYDSTSDELIRFLNILFARDLDNKNEILEKELGIKEHKEDKEVKDMCNYSDYVFDGGVEKGIKEGISQVKEYLTYIHDGYNTVEKLEEKGLTKQEAEETLEFYNSLMS